MAHQRPTRTRRVWLPGALLLAFALVALARLVQIQVIEHDRYVAEAQSELLDSDTIAARRGAILDRNGAALAISVDTWDLYVSSRVWKDPALAVPASEAIAVASGLEAAAIREYVRTSGLVDVLVARDVPYEAGRELIENGVAGLVALPNTEREYPGGDTGASVLGLTGADNTGLSGIEAWYDELLRGTPGRVLYERDTSGDPIPYGTLVTSEPEPGTDLVLTIDRRLQKLAEGALAEALEEHEAKGGAIVMMDPRSGAILAMATSPSLAYSTLDLSDASQVALLRNRAVTDVYEPGSVMKVVTAAAAIDAGVVTEHTEYVDNGVARVYDTDIRNWDDNVYGLQTMTGVLQHSINTGAVYMADALGEAAFHEYLTAFGFGRPTGIDLQGEAPGIVREPDDPGWSPVDLATQSFGQSISVTPIQMVAAVAATINGGYLVKPHLVAATISADGERTDRPAQIVGQPITPDTSATIREMLRAVVEPGWYHPGKPRHYSAGGKSGTANVPIPNGYDDTQIASFIGFSPADEPRLLIYVKIDENQDFLTGTAAAGPVFAKLVDEALPYLHVPPDESFVEAR